MKTVKSFVKYLISLGIAGLLLWLVFKDLNLHEVLDRLKTADYRWAYISIIMALTSHYLRAFRWTLMLKPMGFPVKTPRAFLSLMSGYLANLGLPRMGEITRCIILKKTDGIPLPGSFGSVILERIIDLIMLGLALLLALVFQFSRIGSFFTGLLFRNRHIPVDSLIGWVMLGIVFLGGLVILGWMFRGKITGNSFFRKIRPVIGELINGLLSIRSVENKPLFYLCTLLIWVLYYLMAYIMVFSFPSTSGLSPMAGLVILVAGSLGMTVPVQGGIGTYHVFVSSVLVLYGIGHEDSVLYATLMHTAQTLFVVISGGICILISLLISNKKNKNVSGTKQDPVT